MNQIVNIAALEDKDVIDLFTKAEAIAADFRKTGAERDRAGHVPHAEIDVLRKAGLLSAIYPKKWGGAGITWPQALHLTRIIARGDSSIGQLLGYHYVNTQAPIWAGTSAQAEEWSKQAVKEGWYWGAAVNPRDPPLTLVRSGDHYLLSGRKTFSTGIRLTQRVTVLAPLDGVVVPFVISSDRSGITFFDDWDNIGQRLTDSGSVEFKNTPVYASDFLGSKPGGPETQFAFGSLNTLLIQLVFANFYLGTAEQALADAIEYVKSTTRVWYTSKAESAAEDQLILERIGEFSSAIQASVALANSAADGVQKAYEKGHALTAEERTTASFPVWAAKVSSTHVSLEVTARIFEVMGARATASHYAFDRYWRNVRTHTLHDPVFYKARDIGAHLVNGTVPPVDLYS